MSEAVPSHLDSIPATPLKPSEPMVRRSPLRTIFTFMLLVVMVVMIGGYVYVTDAERVRSLSQSYLTELTGGRVSVGKATLSIFEGLRLDDIRIDLNEAKPGESSLFEAKSLQINYSPKALLFGKIEATRILAMEPRAFLVENIDDGVWNFQRLGKPSPPQLPAVASSGSAAPLMMPEVLLRSARVEYSQIEKGRRSNVGSMTIEGQLTPDVQNLYRFRLQSRGGTSGVFPIVEGWLTPGGDQVGVVLRDVEFVDEIKTILPAVVRKFWEDHALAGRIGETRVSYFRKENGKAGFRVETDLDGVRLVIPPSQWMDAEERTRVERWKRSYTRLSLPVLGSSGTSRLISGAMMPGALQLDEVDGTFVFTDEKIAVNSLVARIENNRFKCTGTADGYGPAAPFKVRIESLKSENLYIPDSPRYITSMPWPVQEIYYRFLPKGACSFWLDLSRTEAGSRPVMAGELQIHDSSFMFERFPYPVEHANGTLRFGNDPTTGREMLEIVSVLGHGYTGGANERGTLEVTGKISPLNDSAGADIVVKGRGLVSEPLLIESMPTQTKKTVKGFDPTNTGKLPTFRGDFDCRIVRAIGIHKPWLITTSIDLHQGAGAVAAFPYPLENLDGRIIVYDDHIDIERINMPKPDGKIEISGKVDWTKRDKITGEPLIQPDIKLTAINVPIDATLIAALPEQKQRWLKKVQLGGNIDLDGRINCESAESDETVLNAALKLHNGTAKLANGQIELSEIDADARISPSALTVTRAKGKRGDAAVEVSASFDLSKDEPEGTITSRVRGLQLDEKLLAAASVETRNTIKSLGPEGTVDADFDYSSTSPDGYRLVVRPRDLSLKPRSFPLKLTKAQGEIIADSAGITLKDFVVQAGDAVLRASGTIDAKSGKSDVTLAGRDLKLTDELRKALSPTVQRLLQSVELKGTVAFDLTKLVIRPQADAQLPSDIDFEGTLWLRDASMQAGVAMTNINGVLKAAGTTRGGALHRIEGDLSFDSLKLAGRDVTRLTAGINKPADKDVLQIVKIDGRIADGQISGQIDSILSEKDSRFGLSLILRNAKVAELTGEIDRPIDGRLTASLALEGKWSDPNSTRGRGDVLVEGQKMYRVPVMFGLMQMANLSLPLESPIKQAGVRYNVEGQKVLLETLDLRSATSAMQGSGWIDFSTKQVQMTLFVANQAADSVPIFGQLIKGAREDFMQIRVRGTLQEPKVGASAFNTFNTTIDEVLKGRE